jgi:hypothetical protein
MRSRRAQGVWWAVFAFVTWNVVFDRQVAVAGSDFARDQILRYQQGQPTLRIEDAFTPRVASAALVASGWAALVAAAGVIIMLLSGRGGPTRTADAHPRPPSASSASSASSA